MVNPICEEVRAAEIPGWISANNGLSAAAVIRAITDHELFGDQGGYPSVKELSCFLHEGRRMIPEIHGDGFPEQLYRLDGCFTLELEEA